MLLKSLVLTAFGLLASASAVSFQERQDIYSDVNLVTWPSTGLGGGSDTLYSFAPGACQAISVPVGSATVDSNASCNVYASSDCSGSTSGTLNAPGNSNIGYSFGSIRCFLPGQSSSTTATAPSSTSSAAAEPTDACEAE